jgi:hypothetical protein
MKLYAFDLHKNDGYGMEYIAAIAESPEDAIRIFKTQGYEIADGTILEEYGVEEVLYAMYIE